MGLLIDKCFSSHSGKDLNFKIECDFLTDGDIKTLSKIISQKYRFKHVYGVPMGGIRLANALKKYCDNSSNQILLVDDVLTTGRSMIESKSDYTSFTKDKIQGVVIFSRGKCPDWIDPIFQLGEWEEDKCQEIQ